MKRFMTLLDSLNLEQLQEGGLLSLTLRLETREICLPHVADLYNSCGAKLTSCVFLVGSSVLALALERENMRLINVCEASSSTLVVQIEQTRGRV